MLRVICGALLMAVITKGVEANVADAAGCASIAA